MGMLEKFVDTNPTPLADAEEARSAPGRTHAGKSGDNARGATHWYQEIIPRRRAGRHAAHRSHPQLPAGRRS